MMREYQCHKRVRAAKIAAVNRERGWTYLALDDGVKSDITNMPQFDKAEVGGYFVQYEDGYTSFSPATAFEAGYTPVNDGGMSFGQALDSLKRGARIARQGWNGKGMWLCLGQGQGHDGLEADKFWNPHTRAFAEQNGGKAPVLPYIIMKTATGEILMGWLASQTDMLAEDWTIL